MPGLDIKQISKGYSVDHGRVSDKPRSPKVVVSNPTIGVSAAGVARCSFLVVWECNAGSPADRFLMEPINSVRSTLCFPNEIPKIGFESRPLARSFVRSFAS